MAGESKTERETILEARVKELEEAAQAQVVSVAKGGVFEATWRTINAIIPTWLAVIALAVFLALQAFGYYMKAQTIEADTQLKLAKADVDKAQADALNAPVDGEPLRLQQVQAELKQKQEQARRARAEADALNAKEREATVKIETVDAEIATAQQKAAKSRVEADALMETSGLKTLAEREVVAKAVTTEMKAADKRISASILRTEGDKAAMVSAACEDNQFPELTGCPAQYIRRKPASDPPPPTPALSSPTAAAQVMRTPSAFDCNKATLGVDYVICSSPQLLDAEARLEDAYRAARAVRGDDVKIAQRAWAKSYGPNCGLPAKGQPTPAEIRATHDCVARAINQRTSTLQATAHN